MEKENNYNSLSGDRPLTNPDKDLLNYAPFAKHLAKSISEMAPPEGLVVAIYGSWGLGKSTVLNFVEYYLKQKPENEQPIILKFNPWWFSGHEDLIKRFFYHLRATLKKRGIADYKLWKQIGDFAEIISEIPLPYFSVAKGLAKIQKLAQQDVPELKHEIAEVLQNQQQRILIIIDDIDRLTYEEIRQLFRVIKAVGDFPNIIYQLAFDSEIIAKALTGTQGLSGEDYLEKIIQVPFELPLPEKLSLKKILVQNLDLIRTDRPENIFDRDHSKYLNKLDNAGIYHFFNTPRDIRRFINTLSVTYPAVKGEVNLLT